MIVRLLAALFAFTGIAQAATIETEIVRGDFVFEDKAVAPGDTTVLALDMTLDPGWHTYWKNAGDSGQPVAVTWTVPDGVTVGEMQWPTPHRQPFAGMVNYGYEDRSTLLMPVTVPVDWPADKDIEMKADVFWLVCNELCIPEQGSTNLTLPIGPTAQDPDAAALFTAARAAIPMPSPYPARYAVGDTHLTLTFEGGGFDAAKLKDVYAFPEEWGVLDHAGVQVAATDASGLTLTIPRSPENDEPPAGTIGGVLEITETAGDGDVTLALSFDAQPAGSGGALPVAGAGSGGGSKLTFGTAMLYAFLGGLILNLMPCVFPILAIKAISVAENAHMSAGTRATHGLAYGAGVLVLFVGLAALMIGLKSAGMAIGWGFQLQNPIIVLGLAYLFFLIGLNLSGVYEINTRLSGIGTEAASQGGARGSFFTGALAGVVATPCTGPFMAGAMGATLLMTGPETLAVFAALGFGMAFPFMLLTMIPGLGRLLPRPGPWMVRMKEILAFPMYATAVWLIWVMGSQTGDMSLLAALIGGVLLALAAWAYGTAQRSQTSGRKWGFGTAIAATLSAIGIVSVMGLSAKSTGPTVAGTGLSQPFTAARLAGLRGEGKPVFLNMTADWCITCKVNERVALSDDFEQALETNGVTYLQGDWTSYDAEITALLTEFGRAGVPLYVIYPRNGEPRLLPQLLSSDMLVEALGRV